MNVWRITIIQRSERSSWTTKSLEIEILSFASKHTHTSTAASASEPQFYQSLLTHPEDNVSMPKRALPTSRAIMPIRKRCTRCVRGPQLIVRVQILSSDNSKAAELNHPAFETYKYFLISLHPPLFHGPSTSYVEKDEQRCNKRMQQKSCIQGVHSLRSPDRRKLSFHLHMLLGASTGINRLLLSRDTEGKDTDRQSPSQLPLFSGNAPKCFVLSAWFLFASFAYNLPKTSVRRCKLALKNVSDLYISAVSSHVP